MLSHALAVSNDPSVLALPSSVSVLVLVSDPLDENREALRQRWIEWATVQNMRLLWLLGRVQDWKRSGLGVEPGDYSDNLSPLPSTFIIPRGLCELGEPAMVIERP
ncbi:hypothetical protein [Aestuariirhabdus litorea]|uniref:Uncharacterized protein n=1 Tax=Aestuariirhabdus litorea TaxID=2528527 RepID=A0A3P3VJD9_9GAMM|nr:hypothetical protein [Aestuariirhabdus litorea]RRJ82820.1 hypothetical protein D0544_13295 [Aestuariirhabdus litorea]RWW92979.1 hypothetical protein DZC74_13270 [Endozoicomonadaceae bacterium GTF-13]